MSKVKKLFLEAKDVLQGHFHSTDWKVPLQIFKPWLYGFDKKQG